MSNEPSDKNLSNAVKRAPQVSPAGDSASATTASSSRPTAADDDVTREQVMDDLRKTITDARRYLEQLSNQGRDVARSKAYETKDIIQDWREQGEEMIRAKPLCSVATALAIGWIIGKLGD